MKKHVKNILLIISLSTTLLSVESPLNAQTIKVIVLAGQSNARGHGRIDPITTPGTLSHFMANDSLNEFAYIQDGNGNWATRQDVWVRYDHENHGFLAGDLTVGFGAWEENIGPELGMGYVLGDYFNEQVLIIKTCWGGKSLAVDFRPPSSGGTVGPYYTQMITDINKAINNISTEFPNYKGEAIELAGFVWFQGWNDLFEPAYLTEYQQNLINLISDVRTALNAPKLPVVVGLTGNHGYNGDGALQSIQTSQINAAEFPGHEYVTYAETRDFWRESNVSPSEASHHWNDNGESYLRIGDAFGIKLLEVIDEVEGASLGSIQANTNAALPSSYNFQEYVFPEPADQGNCQGISNNSATIQEVFMAQTHRHAIGHPLFFTIGHRPALLQLAVTGTGTAPDVQVQGILNGTSLGTLCLAGPDTLSSTIDLNVPDFENYFSVTLPKSWVQDGLELVLTAGNATRALSAADLKIGPYTEMNLVMVNMDLMDYNGAPHKWPVFYDFLQEMASAIPASVVRFGIFPETLPFQEVIVDNNNQQLVRLKSKGDLAANGIGDGSINAHANAYLSNLHRSTGDYLSTVYFGNTLNLAPGGLGGGKSFVSFDYTNVFIQELGHALGLPHWGEGPYGNPNNGEDEYLYPYAGASNNGDGRGQSWNFIQDVYEFVDPICQYDNGNLNNERSDCMQRNHPCQEQRTDGRAGPWDGFSDFSALAMHRYLVGASVQTGQVSDNSELKNFQLNKQPGFPTITLDGTSRVYTREALQPQEPTYFESFDLPGEEQIEKKVYLIYGTAHETQTQANIVFRPVKFTGTLPPIIDPTDSVTLAQLKGETYIPYLSDPRDIVLKMTYADGSILHALNPFHSFARAPYNGSFGVFRNDFCTFSLVVPGDKELAKVEMYKRPFCIRWPDDNTPGNINYEAHDITAENFMDEAVFLGEYDFGNRTLVLGTGTIGNRIWHDLNQNGMDDNEPGIAGVSVLLWGDGNGDNMPDSQGFKAKVKTNENGHYSFTGLGPGNYLAFVGGADNWEAGKPLYRMSPTGIFAEDPNSDANLDNNGRPGNIAWGLTDKDIVSGMITLTTGGEPLNDGDRIDSWFNYDPSGNMTIDFGFYGEDDLVTCNGLSTDTGGATEQYSDYENIVRFICPDDTDKQAVLTFIQFDVEVNYDALYIYDGPSITSPLFSSGNPPNLAYFPAGGYDGRTLPGSFTSTHPSGCLTLEFKSDYDIVGAGWSATITCVEKNSCNLTLDLARTHETCYLCNNGTAVANVSGGSGQSYTWSNGATSPNPGPLTPGVHYVQVTYGNSCTISDSVIINPYICQGFTITPNVEDVLCFGECNGVVDLVLSNGSQSFQALWTDGSTATSREGLCVGTYTITVKDADNCVATDSVEVDQPALFSLDGIDVTPAQGGATGSISINYTGGQGKTNWLLNGIAYPSDDSLSVNQVAFSGLTPQCYVITGIDESGCKVITDSICVDNISAIKDLAQHRILLFPNPAKDVIHISNVSPLQDYSIQITDMSGKILHQSENQKTVNISALNSGIYLVTVTSAQEIYSQRLIKI